MDCHKLVKDLYVISITLFRGGFSAGCKHPPGHFRGVPAAPWASHPPDLFMLRFTSYPLTKTLKPPLTLLLCIRYYNYFNHFIFLFSESNIKNGLKRKELVIEKYKVTSSVKVAYTLIDAIKAIAKSKARYNFREVRAKKRQL